MDTTTILTTLGNGLKRKALEEYMASASRVRDTYELDLKAQEQKIELTKSKLAAVPDVKTEAYEEAQRHKNTTLAQISLDFNDAFFKNLAVGDQVWIRTATLTYAKATITALQPATDMQTSVQYRLRTKDVDEKQSFNEYPRSMSFKTIGCLPVRWNDLDEAATQAWYQLIASVSGETLFFL